MVFLPWTISDKALWVHQVWKQTQNIHTFYLLSWIREKKMTMKISSLDQETLNFDLIWFYFRSFFECWKQFLKALDITKSFHLMNDIIVWFYNAVKLYVFQRMCFKLNSIFGWTNCPKIDHLINKPTHFPGWCKIEKIVSVM